MDNQEILKINPREEAYNYVKENLMKNFTISVSLANDYHSRKDFYRSQKGLEKITNEISQITDDKFEIYTLKSGKIFVGNEVFEIVKNDFVESLEFQINQIEIKIENYKQNEQIQTKEYYEKYINAYQEIKGTLQSLNQYAKENSWSSKNTINKLYDKVREINKKYNPIERVKIN